MNILYVANARIPTEKAHGVAILRACEAFNQAGAPTTLVVARRRNPLRGDAAAHYGFDIKTPIVRLVSLDLYGFVPELAAFAIQASTFYFSLLVWALVRLRSNLVYTRDLPAVGLARLGFKVIYECHHISSNKRKFFERARQAHKIVVISQALKHVFVEAGFDERSILVAPSGVSLDIFAATVPKDDARKQLGLSTGFWGVYTGNFTTFGEDKGISDILAALPRVPGMHFAAVGGSEKDIERYAKEARELGVSERATFVGTAPQITLALYQQAADVLVMPFPDTPHYRNHMSPVKMFEYMASGRPIVTTDLPTIREVLNEQNAYIVPPGDPAALAAVLERVRNNPTEAAALAAAAKAEVGDYSWEKRAQKVLQFIEA